MIDPVMVSESGAVLLDDDARGGAGRAAAAAGHGRHPEHPRGAGADRRGGGGVPGGAGPRGARARPATRSSSPAATASEVVDLFFDGARLVEIPGERHPDGAAHGSGCTHSSALAAFLARGDDAAEAARRAREVASEAVAAGLREIGAGPGPGRRLRALAPRRRPCSSRFRADEHRTAAPRPSCPRPRSATVFDGPDRAHARAYMKGDRLRRRRAQPADDRDRQHLDRGDALQLPPARPRRARQRGRPRRRRHADGVQHRRRLRRGDDGHPGDEGLAGQPRGDRRLDRADGPRLPVRRDRRPLRLRQDDPRLRDGAGPARRALGRCSTAARSPPATGTAATSRSSTSSRRSAPTTPAT